MTFPTDDIFLGPASFGVRKGSEGFAWHTTEGSGPSRAAAVATAQWQKTNPGSYNFIIYDGGLLLTVPYLEASGGLGTGSAAWAPERYPWLKTMLTPAAYADPNAYLMNVAFSGKAADLAAGKYPANMIDTAARLVIWFEASAWGQNNAIMTGHFHWQTNRTDPGAGVIERILKRYAELKAVIPAPAPAPAPVLTPEQQIAALKADVTRLKAQLASKNVYFDLAGAKVRTLEKFAEAKGWEPALRPYIEAIRIPLRAGRKVGS